MATRLCQSKVRMSLHQFIKSGNITKALIMSKAMRPQDLRDDKIDNNWSLHYLPEGAFLDNGNLEILKELVKIYLKAGWDIDSTSTNERCQIPAPGILFSMYWPNGSNWKGFTLLHVACLNQSPKFVQFLLTVGANINMIVTDSRGGRLDALQISLLCSDFKTAELLVEMGANPYVIGKMDSTLRFTDVVRPRDNLQNPHGYISFSSMEIFLSEGPYHGGRMLRKMLDRNRHNVHLLGTNELHVAAEGGNSELVLMILQEIACRVPLFEASWVRELGKENSLVPLFTYVIRKRKCPAVGFAHEMDLMDLLGKMGYDFNTAETDGSGKLLFALIYKYFTTGGVAFPLLEKLLSYPNVKVSVLNEFGQTTVACVLESYECYRNIGMHPTMLYQLINLLLVTGCDVTSLKLTSHHYYYTGFDRTLKLLFSAGAKLEDDYFTSNNHPATPEKVKAELKNLQSWVKANSDQCKLRLTVSAGLATRQSVRTIGDLQSVIGIIPFDIKHLVTCAMTEY